ncbi:general stress protein [Zavarzinella formosa]|uniref:general stress protein n=1 Tax=Zavarzinella formosa TaxID=360055 RepID=UPI0002F86DCE|nr:general stress protein [Zavarzinella formosa]
MTSKTNSAVVGVFENRHDADQAVADLRAAGFTSAQIGVVGHNKDGWATDKTHGNKAEEGALIGAGVGAGVGGLVGLGILAGLIPAIGPVIAGGALAALLANAAGGAAIAGLVGTLVGLGLPEEDAKYYDDEFRAGRTVVTVNAEGRHGDAFAIIRRNNGYNRDIGSATGRLATPAV